MTIKLTRRVLLAGTIGTAGATIVGVQYVYFSDTDLLHSTLERLVGEFDMSKPDLTAFTADFKTIFPSFDGLKAHLMSLAELSGSHSILPADVPPGANIESFERALLTSFVMSTDYLEALKAPQPVPISYNGVQSACVNPFAQFIY